MNELRKDYILNRYVIISPKRGERPHLIREIRAEENKTCPFCAGNEHLIPKIISETRVGDSHVRVIPNRYSAVTMEGDPRLRTDNSFYTYASAYGSHEVIIETLDHDVELEDLTVEHIAAVMRTYVQRIRALNDLPNIKYVSVFKNRGKDAGASIRHSHSQVIAYNILPAWIEEEILATYRYYVENERCPHCGIIAAEKGSDRRVCEDMHFAAFTPYASRFPYEARIYPKRHVPNIANLSEEEIMSLAAMLKRMLLRLDALGYPPYNLEIHNAELTGENHHFHIEILPRLSTWAGFELETGTVINTVSPEDAARFYREE